MSHMQSTSGARIRIYAIEFWGGGGGGGGAGIALA
jgi:hypothetical protein